MREEILFGVVALLLAYAGARLLHYGEALAEKTRLSATWIGLFLVAAVTSVPELVTGVGSIVVIDEPDFAAGDVFGSTLFNLALACAAAWSLAGVRVLPGEGRLYRIAAAYFTGMAALVLVGLGLAAQGADPRWIGLATATMAIVYFAGSRHLFHAQAASKRFGEEAWATLTRRRVIVLYAVYSALVVAAALLLPWLAQRIADERGLDHSFVGTILLAGTTSLPEVVVTLAAIRRRNAGLALGGLLGSNLFDLIILVVDDVFYARGPLLSAIDAHHAVTVAVSLVMTWLVIGALPGGGRPRRALLGAAFLVYALFIGFSGAIFQGGT